ncbi:MAG: dockerin type I domain-containing protein [Candidatus Berkelbacteria bacterium]
MPKIFKFFAGMMAIASLISFPMNAVAADGQVSLVTVSSRQVSGNGTVFYGKTVAQLIADESNEHNINPRMILAILQRESSSITQTSPSSETVRTWPMFYMYDERMATCLNQKDPNYCSDALYGNATYLERANVFGGLGHQIAYSVYNFDTMYNKYASSGNYSNDTTVDGTIINPANIATKVLYAYTPHISAYNTNSNFWTYYTKWWGAPNGGVNNINNIFSNDDFRNSSPMTGTQINDWLKSVPGAGRSWLADYVISEYIAVPYPSVAGGAVNTPPPVPGDFNGDRTVEILDLSMFASYWGQTDPGNPLVDMNRDGVVDIVDLSMLASYWK